MEEIKSAEEATEIAVSFIKRHRHFAQPFKAARENDVWLVEIDVGLFSTILAKVKIDAGTGTIREYHIPSEPI